MKKIVKLELEVESDDEKLLTLPRIVVDLEKEINCCDFWYEIITISLENLPITQNDTQNEKDEPMRHGYFEQIKGSFGFPLFQCSECNMSVGNPGYRFCPNCGAKMDIIEDEK